MEKEFPDTKVTDEQIKEYYNQELADKVYHMYKWDFKMFGYKRIAFKQKSSAN